MRPPKGYKSEEHPLLHKLIHGFGLSMGSDTVNTALIPIVMYSNEMDKTADLVVVNPKNTSFESDSGPLCRDMSIIDRLRISMKFTMTAWCGPSHHASGVSGAEVFVGDDIPAFTFLWRPIFNVFPEKLDAADDDTGTTVAAILALTKDATFEDVVPLTTNKLLTNGPSDSALPASTVNAVQVFGDYNMTTNLNMEDHVFDEDLLQTALRRYTNKGALRSCIGRTRHVTLSRNRPYKNFYIDKFVPRAIRRLQPYGFFGIQIHVPEDLHVSQHFMTKAAISTEAHLGVKMITNYHEWHQDFRQESVGDGT